MTQDLRLNNTSELWKKTVSYRVRITQQCGNKWQPVVQ